MTEAHGKLSHFVSDLHLLASRSYGDNLLEPIREAASRSSDFVLGGDIFDFRWSTAGSTRESVETAVRWLKNLVDDFPCCQFHYVLGNHDHHSAFLEKLNVLSKGSGNFNWDPLCIRIQNTVFLHGDAADGHANALSLKRARERNLHEEPRRIHWHRAYDAVVRTGIHKPAPWLVHPHRRVVRRLMAWLEAEGHGPREGVESVYFGHTHNPMELEYCGVWFYNGGGAIRGQPCRVLRIQHRDRSS